MSELASGRDDQQAMRESCILELDYRLVSLVTRVVLHSRGAESHLAWTYIWLLSVGMVRVGISAPVYAQRGT